MGENPFPILDEEPFWKKILVAKYEVVLVPITTSCLELNNVSLFVVEGLDLCGKRQCFAL